MVGRRVSKADRELTQKREDLDPDVYGRRRRQVDEASALAAGVRSRAHEIRQHFSGIPTREQLDEKLANEPGTQEMEVGEGRLMVSLRDTQTGETLWLRTLTARAATAREVAVALAGAVVAEVVPERAEAP